MARRDLVLTCCLGFGSVLALCIAASERPACAGQAPSAIPAEGSFEASGGAESERLPNGLWPNETTAGACIGEPIPSAAGPGWSSFPHARAPDGDPADGTWTEAPPPPRIFHAGAYDPTGRQLVVFGGTDGSTRNDVWVLPLVGRPYWRQLRIQGDAPAPRVHAAMVYDPLRRRMIVYGGSAETGIGVQLFSDVWELTLSPRPRWREIPTSGLAPSPRRGSSAIHDAARDRIVVFGGLTVGDTWSDETWTLSLSAGGSWSELRAAGTPPPRRWHHSAIYDPVHERMVVFGGNGIGGFATNDAHTLSLGGDPAWSMIRPAGVLPPAIFKHSAIYDPVDQSMVVYGGEGSSGYWVSSETWRLRMSGEPVWSRMEIATSPLGRWSHVGIYDSHQRRLVVFGGTALMSDTWALTLDDPHWAPICPRFGAPVDRQGHSAIYDPVRDRMIIYGTSVFSDPGPSFDRYGSAWQLSFSPRAEWRKIEAPDQPALDGNHPAFYDPVGNRMLVIRSATGQMDTVSQLALGPRPAWSSVRTVGPTPAAPGWVTTAFDSRRMRLIVFGLGTSTRETWSLEVTPELRWVPLSVANPPQNLNLFHARSIYDPLRNRLLTFGGLSQGVPSNEVWALSLDDPASWALLAPLGTPPEPAYGSAMIYDPKLDRMIVFGGHYDRREAWSLSLRAPERWVLLKPSGPLPNPRSYASAIYDPRRERMVVFGGNRGYDMEDTWFLSWHAPAHGDQDEEGRIADDEAEDGILESIAHMPARSEQPTADRGGLKPADFSVYCRPNPFSSTTQIELTLPRRSDVHVAVHDAMGRKVREFVRRDLAAGRHHMTWDGRDGAGRSLASGVYFLRLDAVDGQSAAHVLLIR